MRIMHIKRTIKTWSDKFKDFFLKALTDSEFQILSSLFHSITGWKKREYSCLTLSKGMLLEFLVVHVDKTLGIISNS